MKLELHHLAPYLPYGISYNYTNLDRVSVLTSDVIARREKLGTLDKIKPILRPLSDLTKEVVSKSLIEEINRCSSNDIKVCLSYNQIDFLISLHFDVFGLIEKGLAIDINSLKTSYQ